MASLKLDGIHYVLANQSDAKRIWRFLTLYFLDQELLCKSIGAKSSYSWMEKFIQSKLFRYLVKQNVRQPTSVLALDEGNDLVGVVLGNFYSSSKPGPRESYSLRMANSLDWIVSPKVYQVSRVYKFLLEECRFSPNSLIHDLQTPDIFIGKVFCVAPHVRGLGIAQELMGHSHNLARKHARMYVMPSSSNLTYRFLAKMDFELAREAPYQSVKDLILETDQELDPFRVMFKRLDVPYSDDMMEDPSTHLSLTQFHGEIIRSTT